MAIADELPEYSLGDILEDNGGHIVYKARRKSDGLSVVIKTLGEAGSPAEANHLLKEARHLEALKGVPGIVGIRDRVIAGRSISLVLEDINGFALNRVFPSGCPDLTFFFPIVGKLVDALGNIHEKGIIHHDINPSNIIYSQDSGEVRIIDFDLANSWQEEVSGGGRFEGTLNYIAPEQTGRMLRRADYRSDYYSLGITLFWFLSGRLPFIAESAAEVIAQHIAKPAPHLGDLIPAFPKGLALVIDKLLQKDADLRYQSIQGIKADLEQCREYWERGMVSYDMVLGEKDLPLHLPVPYKLYGREETLHDLGGRLRETARDGFAVWVISGPAGVGKSRLAKAVSAEALQEGAVFCEGKFDQVNRNVPYVGWSQAMGMLLQDILMLPANELNSWRERLEAALGGRGRVLFDMLPQLRLLVGEQPELPPAQGAEARNRFQFVFLDFLRCFAHSETPLVIFLDDLQWADEASLDLLGAAMLEENTKGLLLIGAMRDDDPEEKKQVEGLFTRVAEQGAKVQTTQLGAIERNALIQLLVDTFRHPEEGVVPLADLIYGKTAGNPLFVLELLQSLFLDGEIYFDARRSRWQWDIEAISRRPLTQTAADLIVQRLQLLEGPVLHTLQVASCLGQRFFPSDLTKVLEKDESEVRYHLAHALVEGLLVARNDLMLFSHDRIRHAVYTLIPEERRNSLHLAIGRTLVKVLPTAEVRERLLEITTQFNHGAVLLRSDEEKVELAEMNRQAETKARLNAAFADAAHYVEMGITLLPAAAWKSDYGLTFALHRDRMQIFYLTGRGEEAEREVPRLKQEARLIQDKVQISRARIAYHSVASNFSIAVDLSLEALKELGLVFPSRPDEKDIEREGMALAAVMGKEGIGSLQERPLTKNPEHLALQELLVAAVTPAYISCPPLFVLLAFRLLRLAFEQGVTTSTPVALIFYSAILANQKKADEAYEAGLLTLRMLDRTGARNERPRVMFLFAATIAHWRRPMAAALPELEEAVRAGIEVGDIEFAAYSLNQYQYQHIFMGQDLSAVINDYARMRDVMIRMRQKMTLDHFNLMEQFVLNLATETADPVVMKGAHIDENEEEGDLIKTRNFFSLTAFYMFKSFLLYLFGQKKEAAEKISLALEHVSATTGMIHLPTEVFLQSLILADRLEAEGTTDEGLSILKTNAELYRVWGGKSEVNYKAKGLMVEASLLRAQRGGLEEILKLYEDAAEWAEECEQRFDQAIANEKAAEFLLARGFRRLALPYLQRSLFAYQLWGAVAKVKEMGIRFKDQLGEAAAQSQGGQKKRTSTSDQTLAHLDVEAILKASNAMSGNIVLEDLLVKVLDIMVGNAGAERGFLLLPSAAGWRVEVSAGMDSPAIRLEPPPLVENSALVSAKVVRYVGRTGEAVLLHNAATSAKFSNDKYIQDNGVLSLLCMPMANLGETEAIVYLENNITSHVFTEEREKLIGILGAQAAISLRNATLFHDLKKKSGSLEESENFLRTLFEGTSASVLLMDDGGTIDCNRAALTMFGAQGNTTLFGKRLWDISPLSQPSGEASDTLAARHFNIAREKGAHRFEWLALNGNGEPFFADVLITSIKYHERLLYHTIITDIDARIRLERKSRELNEERNYFTAVSAHELYTPITHLQTALALLDHAVESSDLAATLGGVKKVIIESFRRLERIADNATLLNKLSSFDLKTSGVSFTLDVPVAAVLETVRKKVQERARKVEIRSMDPTGLAETPVMGDWRVIERMLTEILSNAVKFSPDGSVVEVRWEVSEKNITLRVTDQGIGFTVEEKGLLLRPYFSPSNIDHHYTSDYGFQGGGLGIGLVLAHRIAELHGGRLEIESLGKNRGSTVTITLPRVTKAAE